MPLSADYNSAAYPERIVLFGSEGGFSRPVLEGLLSEGVSIAAVVMPSRAKIRDAIGGFPVAVEQAARSSSLAGLAAAHDLPVLTASDLSDHRLTETLPELGADILLVACFPWKLPRTLWHEQRSTCWNLHPSLLPKYRGPAPLFWQLRYREHNTGVTLHEVSEHIDAGDIVAQASQDFPTNTSAAALDEWVAELGVDLFVKALDRYRRDCLVTSPQNEAAASYFPRPAQALEFLDLKRKRPQIVE